MSVSSEQGMVELRVVGDGRASRDEVRPGTYVTDGVNLYRHIVSFNPPRARIVELEDCKSLDVLLVPTGEYRSWGVRPVIAGGVTPLRPRV